MKNPHPNVVVILSDQLRRQALSCYGDKNIETKNIDMLAETGVNFTNACSSYPLCIPFRYSFMTGRYAHESMVPALGWRMSPAERTLADEFNESGYDTAYFGKWHLYGGQINLPGYSAKEENLKPVPRTHQGRWNYWRGFDLRNAPFDTCYFADDDPVPRKIEGYQTDGLTDLFIEYLNNKVTADKPFCAVLSVEPPHPPWEAPAELEEKWLNKEIELPPNFMVTDKNTGDVIPFEGFNALSQEDREQVLRDRRIYYGMVENLDTNVGRVVAALKEKGVYDDTIIIFVSDHGELGGAHSLSQKCFPYEESIGIPLIITGPGIKQGTSIEQPMSSEDIFPTILGLAGITPEQQGAGADLSSLAKGETTDIEREGVLLQFVWEPRDNAPFFGQVWRGFRSRRYKYTVLGDYQNGLKPWQLFDLQNDPYEMNNLVSSPEYESLLKEHHLMMIKRMDEIGDDALLHVRV